MADQLDPRNDDQDPPFMAHLMADKPFSVVVEVEQRGRDPNDEAWHARAVVRFGEESERYAEVEAPDPASAHAAASAAVGVVLQRTYHAALSVRAHDEYSD